MKMPEKRRSVKFTDAPPLVIRYDDVDCNWRNEKTTWTISSPSLLSSSSSMSSQSTLKWKLSSRLLEIDSDRAVKGAQRIERFVRYQIHCAQFLRYLNARRSTVEHRRSSYYYCALKYIQQMTSFEPTFTSQRTNIYNKATIMDHQHHHHLPFVYQNVINTSKKMNNMSEGMSIPAITLKVHFFTVYFLIL